MQTLPNSPPVVTMRQATATGIHPGVARSLEIRSAVAAGPGRGVTSTTAIFHAVSNGFGGRVKEKQPAGGRRVLGDAVAAQL